MKKMFVLCFISIIIPAPLLAQNVDYKVPQKLDAADFQTLEDRAFLDNFDEIPIPTLMRKMLRTDEEHIAPWLRQQTADANDYQLTIEIMRRGVLVTDKQFAWIKKEVEACAEILHLSSPPRVFIVGDATMLANVVDFKDPFIILSSDLIEKSNPKALRFIIGRLMGHIKCDHVFYRTLFSGGLDSLKIILGHWVQELVNSFLERVTDLILVDWTLAREISADRAGLIACQDLQVAHRALLNFKLAMDIDQVKINVEDYLQQAQIIAEKQAIVLENLPESAQKGLTRWQRSNQLESDYPFLFERLKALEEYANSPAYRKLFE